MTGYDLQKLTRNDAAQSCGYSVAAPQRWEGVSSALRVAFGAPTQEAPVDEFERLLGRLN